MEYNIVTAPSLELLATEVAAFLPQGWKLKGGILEHNKGYAQQLVRNPSDRIRPARKEAAPKQHRRMKWIE
ncbi:hypothetical protein [Pontibacter sp. SGAir0037]|uniref:hypothetical protein n=1 Tax=Pontibacter sp. SGAir0037 TaxID=2571030 RepID=UPI0010CCFB2C|nr:hypothetical protein [Pontibacter sp. SGAir0037]QCR25022.1 hypothetical protein C1N53_10960 [Pontibacter sp. SGAir0037]